MSSVKLKERRVKIYSVFVWMLALTLMVGVIDVASAKEKGGKSKDKKVQLDGKPDKGQKAVPPGQIKRYTRGAKLPADLDYSDIGDLSNWKLKPPGKGNRYIRVNDEILEVSDDLSTVVDAVGIVGDLAK